jgi:hypothetical protein
MKKQLTAQEVRAGYFVRFGREAREQEVRHFFETAHLLAVPLTGSYDEVHEWISDRLHGLCDDGPSEVQPSYLRGQTAGDLRPSEHDAGPLGPRLLANASQSFKPCRAKPRALPTDPEKDSPASKCPSIWGIQAKEHNRQSPPPFGASVSSGSQNRYACHP